MNRPHVVILGAGASKAACPNGDRDGRKLPLMNDLVSVANLGPIFKRRNVLYDGSNFEAFYSQLCGDPEKAEIVEAINGAIREYFSDLHLPETPTLYDHLVLSLTEKDLIATFNWDPFLYAAFYRNRQQPRLPQVVYLHGNVAIGFCAQHPVKSANGSLCSRCGEPLIQSNLLYPIGKKNYSQDTFISKEWNALRHYLKAAFVLTIFGYSAPASDVEAVELMRQAWGDPNQRELEEIEIIDLKPDEELAVTWRPFIHTHHYRIANNFYSSILASFPTASCEAMWQELIEAEFLDYNNRIPPAASFAELWEWRGNILANSKSST